MVNSSRDTQEKDVSETCLFLKSLMTPRQVFLSSIVISLLHKLHTLLQIYSRQSATSKNVLTRDVDM